MKVVILGASDKPDRYSYKAKHMLTKHDHETFLVHPKLKEIEQQKVYGSLDEIKEKIHTLTIYVSPEISDELKAEIINLKPKRVIFNPGSENPNLYDSLRENQIEFEEACTLVLLSTDQF